MAGVKRVAEAVARYAVRGTAGMTPESRAAAVAGYAAAGRAMAAYEAEVGARLSEVDMRFVDRGKARALVRRAWRLLRRATPPEAPVRARQAAAEATRQGLSPGLAATVCAICAQALGFSFDEQARRRLARPVPRRTVRTEGTMEKQEKQRKPRPKQARGLTGAHAACLQEESPLERLQRERSMVVLAEVLDGHQPLVKASVVMRLVKGLKPEEIAKRLGLPLGDVKDVLGLMREQVAKRTEHFERRLRHEEGLDMAAFRMACREAL